MPAKANNYFFGAVPLRLRVGQLAGRLLPPLVSPTVTSQLYPYSRAFRNGGDIAARSIGGFDAQWPLKDVHAYHLALNGYYDWRLLCIAQGVCRPGDLVVEVGANIGTETVGFAHTVGATGKVLAFEPFPANVRVLQNVVDSAGLASRVEIHPVAIAESCGELSFVAPDEEGMSGVGYIVNAEQDRRNSFKVSVRTLNDVLKDSKAPGFIAIDVEGAEIAVLRGAHEILRRARPVVVAEACARHLKRAGASLDELHAEFERLGYVVRSIVRFGLRPPDLESTAHPCNWLAVPRERAELIAALSWRIKRCGLLPPWPGLNPLAG